MAFTNTLSNYNCTTSSSDIPPSAWNITPFSLPPSDFLEYPSFDSAASAFNSLFDYFFDYPACDPIFGCYDSPCPRCGYIWTPCTSNSSSSLSSISDFLICVHPVYFIDAAPTSDYESGSNSSWSSNSDSESDQGFDEPLLLPSEARFDYYDIPVAEVAYAPIEYPVSEQNNSIATNTLANSINNSVDINSLASSKLLPHILNPVCCDFSTFDCSSYNTTKILNDCLSAPSFIAFDRLSDEIVARSPHPASPSNEHLRNHSLEMLKACFSESCRYPQPLEFLHSYLNKINTTSKDIELFSHLPRIVVMSTSIPLEHVEARFCAYMIQPRFVIYDRTNALQHSVFSRLSNATFPLFRIPTVSLADKIAIMSSFMDVSNYPTNILSLMFEATQQLIPSEAFVDSNATGMFDSFFSPTVKHEIPALDSLLGIVSERLDSLSSTVKTSCDRASVAKIAISIVTQLVLLWRGKTDMISIAAVIINFLVAYNIEQHVCTSLIAYIKPYLTSLFTKTSEAKSFSDILSSDISPLASVFTAVLGVFVSSKLPGQKVIDTTLNRVSSIGRAIQGGKGIVEFLVSLFDKILDSLYTWYTGFPSSARHANKLTSDLADWFAEIQALIPIEEYTQIPFNMSRCIEICNLYNRAHMFSIKMASAKLSAGEIAAFNVHFRTLTKYYLQVLSSGKLRTELKTEPAVIYLFGKSGMGKSGAAYLIAQDLIAHHDTTLLGPEGDQTEQNIYYRNVEQDYWDGYAHQLICIYDDFGQKVDSSTEANLEFMEIIRTANLAEYPLHMANLDEKARTRFTSKALILTANSNTYDITSLTHKDAFERRIDLKVEVTVKSEYLNATGTLDPGKVFAKTGESLSSEMYEFMLYNRSYDEPSRTTRWTALRSNNAVKKYSYEQFIDMAKTTFDTKIHNSTSQQNALSARGRRLIDGTSLSLPTPASTPRHISPLVTQFSAPSSALSQLNEVLEEETLRDAFELPAENLPQGLTTYSHICNHFLYLYGRKVWQVNSGQMEIQSNLEPSAMDIDYANFSWYDNNGIAESDRLVLRKFALDRDPFEDDFYTYQLQVIDYLESIDFDDYLLHDTPETLQQYCSYKHHLTPASFLCNSPDNGLTRASNIFFKQYHKRVAALLTSPIVQKIKLLAAGLVVVGGAYGIYKAMTAATKYFATPREALSECSLITRASTISEYPLTLADKCAIPCDFCAPITVTSISSPEQLERVIQKYSSAQQEDSADVRTRYNTKRVSGKSGKKSKSHALFGPCEFSRLAKEYTPGIINQENYLMYFSSLCYFNCKTCYVIRDAIKLDPESHSVYFTFDPEIDSNSVTKIFEKFLAVHNVQTSSAHSLDANADDLIFNKISTNFFHLSWSSDKGGGRVTGLVVKERYLLTVRHAIPFIEASGNEFMLSSQSHPEPMTFSLNDCKLVNIKYDDDSLKDAVIIELPRSFMFLPDITSHFALQHETANYSCIPGSIPIFRKSLTGLVLNVLRIDRLEIRDRTYSKAPGDVYDNLRYTAPLDGQILTYTMPSAYVGSFSTAAGDCGGPLIAMKTNIPHKLLGIVVCGNKAGKSSCLPITHEDITSALQELNPSIAFCNTFEIPAQFKPNPTIACPDGNFIALGHADKMYTSSGRTDLAKSAIFNSVSEYTTMPSRLSPFKRDGVLVDPLFKGLAKCGVVPPPIPSYLIDAAVSSYKPIVLSGKLDKYCRILSLQEAIEGVPGDALLPPLNRRSSPGWPFVWSATSSPGKTHWLGEHDYKFDDPILLAAIEHRLQNAKHGIRTFTPWINCLKDERRPIEKVIEGKTRCFTCGPQDYLILFRQYFLGFNAHFMYNKIDNESAVGSNVYGLDWDLIVLKLKAVGVDLAAGDFANFDGCLSALILWSIFDIISEYFNDGPENYLIRKTLWYEIVNSVHLARDVLFMWTHSQPSGNPVTTIINTMYQCIAIRIVYLILMKDTPYASLSYFIRFVAVIAFGDDNVYCISKEILPWFNQLTLPTGFAVIGMTYTDESKGQKEVTEFGRPIEQVSFLKRSFRFCDISCRWLAPLELPVILEMCNWVRSRDDLVDSTLLNVETAIMELSLHGKEVFDKYSALLNAACLENTSRLPLTESFLGHLATTQDLSIFSLV